MRVRLSALTVKVKLRAERPFLYLMCFLSFPVERQQKLGCWKGWMVTAVGMLSSECELYISHGNFKTMHSLITGRELNEHEWECDWVSEVLPALFPPPHPLLCKSWGVVAVVGSCGGTDSGTSTSPPSYPVFPISLNVMNKYCAKSLRPASCWKWT